MTTARVSASRIPSPIALVSPLRPLQLHDQKGCLRIRWDHEQTVCIQEARLLDQSRMRIGHQIESTRGVAITIVTTDTLSREEIQDRTIPLIRPRTRVPRARFIGAVSHAIRIAGASCLAKDGVVTSEKYDEPEQDHGYPLVVGHRKA